jgi:transcriptional regulator with XRE-family HTH domain
MATFGELLQALRHKAGLTQASLAQKAGVSLRNIQGWEINYRCPVSGDFFKLARALNVSADAFADCIDGRGGSAKPAKRKRGK